MKIMTCFIDSSAWAALADNNDINHEAASEYFRKLLESNSKLVTNNTAVDHAILTIKDRLGPKTAQKFMAVIDESILTVNLRSDWISRRIRRNALNLYLKSTNPDIILQHYYIIETIKRKKVDIVFTFDQNLNILGLPLMPQKSSVL